MNRVIRLLIISICNYVIADFSVEIDGLKDDAREHSNKNGNKQMLLGVDYYNGVVDADSVDNRADYGDDDYHQELQFKSETENQKPLKQEVDYGKNIVILDTMDTRNYRAEMEVGNRADLLGKNPHYYQPNNYPDFSRRFVLQYPYTEKEKRNKDDKTTDELKPKLASPELVLAVAKKSALLDATAPRNHNDTIVRKEILRTGNYWNAVWKEDADPKVLRTRSAKKLESIRAEIPPGTKLYDLVSKLKHMPPTLLYVLNEKNK